MDYFRNVLDHNTEVHYTYNVILNVQFNILKIFFKKLRHTIENLYHIKMIKLSNFLIMFMH